jgi:cobalamin biosynthesis protein CobD/CbiB
MSGLSTITHRLQLDIWFRCTIPVKFVIGKFQLGLLHPAFKTLTVAQWLDREWQKQPQKKKSKPQIAANVAMTISLLVAFITGTTSSVSTTAFLCYHIPYKHIAEHAYASQS